MEAFFNPLMLSRVQFAVTTIFHMLWPLLSIGLSFLMVIMEIMWLRTKDEAYYRHVRFWSRIFILTFGIGVASGLPLEFEFGTNWAGFSKAAGDFFGNILGFEGSMAFALEAAFLAIFIFGWKRVSKGVHLFSTIMVAFGASLSAFWIMDANSWMQTPAGVRMINGRIEVTNYLAAVFNPDLGVSFSHMWVACVETTLFFVAGISAWYILRKKHIGFFLKSFKIAVILAVVITPLQIYLGDLSGRTVVDYQPAKAAAMEAHWNTNAPGTGAPWAIVAWPDPAGQKNLWAIEVPDVLSLLSYHTFTGQVTGLKAFPKSDQPPIALPFYAFRIMVLLGFIMAFMMLLALWYWYRGKLRPDAAAGHEKFWKIWYCGIPLGFIATELGWIVREVGRQPWIIYNLMRTDQGVSKLSASTAAVSLLFFTAVYVALFVLFVTFTRKILVKGPDLTSPVPGYTKDKKPSDGKGKR